VARKPRAANEFTKATNRTLGRATSPKTKPIEDPYVKMISRRARSRAKAYEAERKGRIIEGVPGYGTVDMDEVGWHVPEHPDDNNPNKVTMRNLLGLSGTSSVPGIKKGPAIDEPHEAEPNVPVERRYEDLNDAEKTKADTVLDRVGSSVDIASKHIQDSYDRAHYRAILGFSGQPAGIGFYGGPSTEHKINSELIAQVMEHPEFKARGLTQDHAVAMVNAAMAATSPRQAVQVGSGNNVTYPNHAAGRVGVEHALAGGDPEDVPKAPHGGIHQNTIRGAKLATQTLTEGALIPELFADSGIKVRNFAGAKSVASSADAFRVNDVHSTGTALPHLATEANKKFSVIDPNGVDTGQVHEYEAEDVDEKTGLPKAIHAKKRLAHHKLEGHTYQIALDSKGKPARGDSPVEKTVRDNVVHSALDLAGRRANAAKGLVPTERHAQATHIGQEIDWRDRQILRPDLPYSLETEHPVTHPLTHPLGVQIPGGMDILNPFGTGKLVDTTMPTLSSAPDGDSTDVDKPKDVTAPAARAGRTSSFSAGRS
jgi:hypothetical protein